MIIQRAKGTKVLRTQKKNQTTIDDNKIKTSNNGYRSG